MFWDNANSSAFYHLVLVDIEIQFAHYVVVNVPGVATSLGYALHPYFQPSPPSTSPHRSVKAVCYEAPVASFL